MTARVRLLLPPLRRRILERLREEPDSAAGLARKFDLPRQRVSYHLHELARAGLLELVEERRRRGCIERTFRPAACVYVVARPGIRHVTFRTMWIKPTEATDRAGAPRVPLAVDWHIEGRAGGTVLRLVHSGFGHDAKGDEEFDGTRCGWTFELGSLRHYLAHHAGQERRAFWVRTPVSISAEDVWAQMTRPGKLLREGRLDTLAVGDRYRVVLDSGDVLEGVVTMRVPPVEVAGTVENLGNGLMRLGCESCAGGPQAHLWLSTWRVPATLMTALESRWRLMLGRVWGQILTHGVGRNDSRPDPTPS